MSTTAYTKPCPTEGCKSIILKQREICVRCEINNSKEKKNDR